jgi:hypothetical protein
VVQNQLNTVAVIRLNHRGTEGTVTQRITDARFDVPTTIARFGDRLYLPNARFGVASPETATYNAVADRAAMIPAGRVRITRRRVASSQVRTRPATWSTTTAPTRRTAGSRRGRGGPSPA